MTIMESLALRKGRPKERELFCTAKAKPLQQQCRIVIGEADHPYRARYGC